MYGGIEAWKSLIIKWWMSLSRHEGRRINQPWGPSAVPAFCGTLKNTLGVAEKDFRINYGKKSL